MRRTRGRGRRGFFFMDVLVGLGMALALLAAVTVAAGHLRRAERQLAEARAEMRQLEAAALALQNGGEPDKAVAVERLSEAAGGRMWVRISLRGAQGNSRSLVALVRADKAGGNP
jgi:hypothetical protein